MSIRIVDRVAMVTFTNVNGSRAAAWVEDRPGMERDVQSLGADVEISDRGIPAFGVQVDGEPCLRSAHRRKEEAERVKHAIELADKGEL